MKHILCAGEGRTCWFWSRGSVRLDGKEANGKYVSKTVVILGGGVDFPGVDTTCEIQIFLDLPEFSLNRRIEGYKVSSVLEVGRGGWVGETPRKLPKL